MKRCKHCGESKSLDDFYSDKKAKDGCRPECKSCNLAKRAAKYADNPAPYVARVKKWQQENADRLNAYRREYRQRPDRKAADRAGYLLRKYGITVAQYDAMLEAQGGVCKICKQPRPEERTLHIDHDHKTGKIRGLLCFRCNNAVGDLRESQDIALALLDYLTFNEKLVARARKRARALRV